jgi:predicted component of type VI protein secretion system
MARLFILSGDHIGQTHDLTGSCNLGRGKDADLVIGGKSVSRLHARLEKAPGGQWVLSDLGSSNGTRVEGQRLDGPCTLMDGETFQLGDVEVRLRLDGSVAPEPAPDPAADPAPPPTPAPAPAPQPDPPSSHDLELEGDWNANAPVPDAPLQSPPAAPISPSRPAAQAGSSAAGAARRAQAMGASAPGAAGRTAAGGKVLQYHKVENRSGLFSTDLSQQSILVRTLLYLLLVAVLGGLMWGAYQMTVGLRRTDGTISEFE